MDIAAPLKLYCLEDYALSEVTDEPSIDRLTALAASIFEMRAASLWVGEGDRRRVVSRFGIEPQDSPGEVMLGEDARRSGTPVVVLDARRDLRLANQARGDAASTMRFHAAMPLLTSHAGPIGALCVADPAPREAFTDAQARILQSLSETAVELLEARARHIMLTTRAREVAYLASHDPLTHLGNRRHLDFLLQESVRRIKPAEQIVLYCLDLDGFKRVNDCLGHPAGDVLLKEVSKRLRHYVGQANSIVRLGGDEFAIVQWSSQAAQAAPHFADGLIRAVAQPYHLGGQRVHVGTSIGACVAQYPAPAPEQLLKDADRALYRAKSTGRGRFIVVESNYQDRLGTKFTISRLGSSTRAEYQRALQAQSGQHSAAARSAAAEPGRDGRLAGLR